MTRRQLALRHIAAQSKLQKLTAAKIERIWRDLGSYDREDLPRWLERAIPVILDAQRQSVVLTDAYIGQAMDRRPLGVNPDDLIGAAVRGGVAPEDELVRPMAATWTALKEGKPWEQAVRAGAVEAARYAVTDVLLASRTTAFAVGQQDKNILGWERVPNPDACELCLIASTQRYTTEHLMPIHERCRCTVSPLSSPTDSIINRDLYRDLKADGAMDRITSQRTVSVREHGELGPVLVKT